MTPTGPSEGKVELPRPLLHTASLTGACAHQASIMPSLPITEPTWQKAEEKTMIVITKFDLEEAEKGKLVPVMWSVGC